MQAQALTLMGCYEFFYHPSLDRGARKSTMLTCGQLHEDTHLPVDTVVLLQGASSAVCFPLRAFLFLLLVFDVGKVSFRLYSRWAGSDNK